MNERRLLRGDSFRAVAKLHHRRRTGAAQGEELTEVRVGGDDDSPNRCGEVEDEMVRLTSSPHVAHMDRVVTESPKVARDVRGQRVVDQEPHRDATTARSSTARAA